jgi:hypothetical protein
MIRGRRRIFVSHASEDDDLANQLVDGLLKRGLKPFLDHHEKVGIVPGEEWLDAMSKDLKKAHAVLILVSDAWRQSQWCQAEYKTAKLLRKRVIPVIIGSGDHSDVEPTRQKVFLEADAPSIGEEALDAIARGLPTNVLETVIVSAIAGATATILIGGIEKLPFGQWHRSEIFGAAVIDLEKDPAHDESLWAVTSGLRGAPDLFHTDDCGDSWQALDLPDEVLIVNKLHVTPNEILLATKQSLWAFDRVDQSWQKLELGGLSADVLVAKTVPGRPHQIIHGTLRPGGASAGASSVGVVGGHEDGPIDASKGRSGGLVVTDRNTNESRSFTFQMNDFAFHPSDTDKIVIAASDDGVFYSTDGLGSVRKIEKNFRTPFGVAFSGDGTEVYVSSRGDFWSFNFPEGDDPTVTIDHIATIGAEAKSALILSNGETIVPTSDGIYESLVASNDLRLMNPNPYERFINDVTTCGAYLLAGSGGEGLFRKRAGDHEWRRIFAGNAFLPATAGLIAKEFSLVSGANYLRLKLSGSQSYEVARGKTNVTTFAARSASDLQTSKVFEGDPELRNQVARASFSYTESLIFAGLSTGDIIKKGRGETQWRTTNFISDVNENQAFVWQRLGPVNSISVSRQNPLLLLAVVNERVLGKSEPGSGVWISSDEGETWLRLQGVDPGSAVTSHALSDGRFLISSGTGSILIFDTEHGVVREMALVEEPPSRYMKMGVTGFADMRRANETLMVSTSGNIYVYRSEQGTIGKRGALSKPSTGRLSINWIDLYCCGDKGQVFAVGRGVGVQVSTDGGRTWKMLALNGLGRETEIFSISDSAGFPSIFSERGAFVQSKRARICITDADCFSWSKAKLMERVLRFTETLF